jgi:hypothetical protein
MHTSAKAPECPLYNNKHACLLSVESNHKRYIDFINQTTDEEDPADPFEKEKLIQASLDIKKYESLACQKTCLD